MKNCIKAYDNIRKITTGQRDIYTTGCLLDQNYLENYQKMMAIDLSKQQSLDSNTKVIQQINFTGNLSVNNYRLMFFNHRRGKRNYFMYFTRNC